MARVRVFTAEQVNAYKNKIFRQHQRELTEVKHEWYIRGKEDGRQELRTNMLELLGLKDGIRSE